MGATSRLTAVLALAAFAAACEGPSGFLTSAVAGNPTQTGTIAGTVTADGAGLGGVAVIAEGAARDSTATDGTGAYRFGNLTTGQYSVSVRVPLGYQLAAGQEGTRTVTVTSSATTNVSFALQRTP